MRHPLTTERAYQLFGLLLGLLPPAAILIRMALLFRHTETNGVSLFFLLLFGLPMTMLSAVIGRVMGRSLAPMIGRVEHGHWFATIISALEAGFIWACVTGATGGALFFVVGALFGLICALPFGLAGFPLFTVCHRLLARGGMIDARHFWPVACGITLTLSALIFGLVSMQ